tara:strand:+ start:69 stop:572 length:504 start_codon:yes stop_codon:yes gene_type:complete
MDISANPLDLIYFTNSSSFKKMSKKKYKENQDDYSKNLKFYRKRILQITKNLLRGEEENEDIKRLFKNYSWELIEHFKFLDKKEILQKDYEDLGENKKCVVKDFELENQNKLMMREKKDAEKKTIESFIDVKIKNKKETTKPYIPKKKVINITLDEFKNKGVKNKSK